MTSVSVLSLALVSGCATTPTTSQQRHDPLHGVIAPPGAPQPGAPKSSHTALPAPQNYQPGTIPALPASSSSANPANLAGASFQGPLGRPLAIDDEGRPVPRSLSGFDFPAPNLNPKVEPVPDAGPTPQKLAPIASWQTPTINVPGQAGADPARETLSRQLQSRGVLQEREETTAQGIRLTCFVSRGPTGGFRVYEATAADYSAAAQAILQQLP